MKDIQEMIDQSVTGEMCPCPICGRDVDSGWMALLVKGERDKYRRKGIRAALEAARGQQSEDFGTANYYLDDDLGLARDDGIMDACLAIERLLEDGKGRSARRISSGSMVWNHRKGKKT